MKFEYRLENTNPVKTAEFKKEKEEDQKNQDKLWGEEENQSLPGQPGEAKIK